AFFGLAEASPHLLLLWLVVWVKRKADDATSLALPRRASSARWSGSNPARRPRSAVGLGLPDRCSPSTRRDAQPAIAAQPHRWPKRSDGMRFSSVMTRPGRLIHLCPWRRLLPPRIGIGSA